MSIEDLEGEPQRTKAVVLREEFVALTGDYRAARQTPNGRDYGWAG